MTQNDVMYFFVAKDVGAATPTTAAPNPIIDATDTYLLDGETAVINAHNIVLSAVTVLTDDLVARHGCRLVQRSGDKLLYSPFIKQNNIISYDGSDYAAPAEQLTYIGYNGSSGAITVNDDSAYVPRITMREQSRTGFGMGVIKDGVYKSDSTATQFEIVFGLALSLNNSFKRELYAQGQQPIKLEVVSAQPVTAANDYTHDATVVNGQDTFTVATDLTYSGATTSVVGDCVRFGTVGGGTALTDGVYKITAISGLTVTVDRPIEAASGTYATATADTEIIPAATCLTVDWGLKLTGIARTWSRGLKPYSKVSFEVGLNDPFESTPVTYNTAMSLGHGYYQDLADLEWQLMGNEANKYRRDFSYSNARTDVLSTANYRTLSMSFYNDVITDGVSGQPRSPIQMVIAIDENFSDTEAPDITIEVFDAYTTITSGIAK